MLLRPARSRLLGTTLANVEHGWSVAYPGDAPDQRKGVLMSLLHHYLKNRLYEWSVTIPLIAVSCMVVVWPQILSAPSFKYFSEKFSAELILGFLFTCSVVCCIALLANGASFVIAPFVRSWAAMGRAVIWFQFSISTFSASLALGYPYTVTPFWVMFMLVEFYVAYRAVLDVRTRN